MSHLSYGIAYVLAVALALVASPLRAATPCTGGTVDGLRCEQVELLFYVRNADISARPTLASDVWGFVDLNSNREYVFAGYNNGTAVLDVTDAENPREVGFIRGQGTPLRDIKVYQYWNPAAARWNALAYVVADDASDGLFIIDLGNLPQSIRRVDFSSDFSAAHNLHITNTDPGTGLSLGVAAPTLIVAGSDIEDGQYRAYSLSDPAAPAFIAMPGSGSNDHTIDAASMVITDARKDTQCVNAGAYCEVLFDFNQTSVDLWDITDPANPARLSRSTYPNVGLQNSGSWSEDKRYLFVHDSLDERIFGFNTTLQVFGLDELTQLTGAGEWLGETRAVDHHGYPRGNRYYMANFTRGLTVLDISTPNSPLEVGGLDTFTLNNDAGLSGAWGVYPFFQSGTIAMTDVSAGLRLVADRSRDVAQGSLAFSAPSFGGTEGETVQLIVNRQGGSDGAVSVDYEIVPSSAGLDDVQRVSGTLNWSDGDAAARTIDIALLVDTSDEALERLLVKLVSPTGGATLANSNIASLYIADPGNAAVVEFDRAEIDASERFFATAVVVLRRSGSAAGAVSVDYMLAATDADAGSDYSGPTSGTISWADGDADPKWIEFAIVDDGTGEADEYLELSLTNPSGAVIGANASVHINIFDGSGTTTRPVANAGANQSIIGGGFQAFLDGRLSYDDDGDELTYAWSQVSGRNVTLQNAGSAVASFTSPSVNSNIMLLFELRVTDPGGLSETSTMTVTVRPKDYYDAGGPGVGAGGAGPLFLLAMALACMGSTAARRAISTKEKTR